MSASIADQMAQNGLVTAEQAAEAKKKSGGQGGRRRSSDQSTGGRGRRSSQPGGGRRPSQQKGQRDGRRSGQGRRGQRDTGRSGRRQGNLDRNGRRLSRQNAPHGYERPFSHDPDYHAWAEYIGWAWFNGLGVAVSIEIAPYDFDEKELEAIEALVKREGWNEAPMRHSQHRRFYLPMAFPEPMRSDPFRFSVPFGHADLGGVLGHTKTGESRFFHHKGLRFVHVQITSRSERGVVAPDGVFFEICRCAGILEPAGLIEDTREASEMAGQKGYPLVRPLQLAIPGPGFRKELEPDLEKGKHPADTQRPIVVSWGDGAGSWRREMLLLWEADPDYLVLYGVEDPGVDPALWASASADLDRFPLVGSEAAMEKMVQQWQVYAEGSTATVPSAYELAPGFVGADVGQLREQLVRMPFHPERLVGLIELSDESVYDSRLAAGLVTENLSRHPKGFRILIVGAPDGEGARLFFGRAAQVFDDNHLPVKGGDVDKTGKYLAQKGFAASRRGACIVDINGKQEGGKSVARQIAEALLK